LSKPVLSRRKANSAQSVAENASALDAQRLPADDGLVQLGSERLVGKTGSHFLLVAFIVLLLLAALVLLWIAYALSG
jgi:hypothetical protein